MREKQLRHAFREAAVRPRTVAAGSGLAVAATLVSGSVAQAAPTFEVDKLADTSGGSCTAMPDDCSLRDAITQSNTMSGSTITFASTVTGTIHLGSPLPTLEAGQAIQGPGPRALTIAAPPYAGAIYVNTYYADSGVSISGLTVTGGRYGIFFQGDYPLSVSNVALTGSRYGLYLRGPAVVDDSTLSSNTYGVRQAARAGLTVSNSTVANSARYGVYMFHGTLTLKNSTVSGNKVGIYASSDEAVTLDSSVAAGNQGADVYVSKLTENFSLIQNTDDLPELEPGSGSNLNGADPQLGPLADNGGPTMTMRPASTSPVIDKGNDYTGTGKDQRGASTFDWAGISNASAGARDMGAVELQSGTPEVTSVSPGRGDAGDSVTITGTDLFEASAVKFGTVDATNFHVVSDTEIRATAPAGTGTADVTITNPTGTSSASAGDKFHYIAPPAITSLSPDHGNPGRQITINGADFTDASAVKFGSTDATNFTVVSDTEITATVPEGSGTIDVRVTTPAGTTGTGSSDEFSYSIGPIEVDTLEDDAALDACTAAAHDDCSLRAAITKSNADPFSTITFASDVTGTIQLASQLPTMSAGQIIQGPGARALTIEGFDSSSTTVSVDTYYGNVRLSGLTVSGGNYGIHAEGSGTLFIARSALTNNTFAVDSGAPIQVADSTVSDNGEGLRVGRTLTVRNSTIADNTSRGVEAFGPLTLSSSTVSGNDSGIDVWQDVTLESSVVAGNDAADVFRSGAGYTLTENFSLIQNTDGLSGFGTYSGGSNLNGSDPQLGPLADNGGPTQTMKPAAASPVVDAGKDYAGTGKDQRGASTFDWPSVANASDSRDMGAFEVQGAPSVTGVSPGSGNAGDTVTISGAHFINATGVKFGSTDATDLQFVSDTEIRVKAPAGSGNVDVTVTTSGGTSADSANDKFHYIAPPTLTSIAPDHGNAGDTVTITGTNFTGATGVKFGSADATDVNVVDATHITAKAPAGNGDVDVTVTNADGTSTDTAADNFHYLAPPTVSALSPDHGNAGDTVTITGTNFTGATGVKFGSADATDVNVVDGTHVTAKAPAGSGTVDVTVTTADGTSATSAGDQFRYLAPPAVSSLSPDHGNAGDTVTITGTNFTGATGVKFGTADATDLVVVDATHITVKAPAGTGDLDVTVTNGDGSSATSSSDKFHYLAPPTVSSLSPGHGIAGDTVAITGTNFTGATGVKFGAADATDVIVLDATHITAKAPAGNGDVDVTVTNADGTSTTSASDKFTYDSPPGNNGGGTDGGGGTNGGGGTGDGGGATGDGGGATGGGTDGGGTDGGSGETGGGGGGGGPGTPTGLTDAQVLALLKRPALSATFAMKPRTLVFTDRLPEPGKATYQLTVAHKKGKKTRLIKLGKHAGVTVVEQKVVKVTIHLGKKGWTTLRHNREGKLSLLTTFKRKLNGHVLKVTRPIKPKNRPKS